MLKKLPNIPEAHLRSLYADLAQHEMVKERENAKNSFMNFVNKVWPNFIEGAHHKNMARCL
jgi:hypothetical protein